MSADLERPNLSLCGYPPAQRWGVGRKEWKTEGNVQLGKKMIFVPFYLGKTKVQTVKFHKNPGYGARVEEYGKSNPLLRQMREARKKRLSDFHRCPRWTRGRARGRPSLAVTSASYSAGLFPMIKFHWPRKRASSARTGPHKPASIRPR